MLAPRLGVRGGEIPERIPEDLEAADGTRTRDPKLGKLVLYQLSYHRTGLRV